MLFLLTLLGACLLQSVFCQQLSSLVFAQKLYGNLTADQPADKNLAFSPLSAEIALLMANLGSCNTTQEELNNLLDITADTSSSASLISRIAATKRLLTNQSSFSSANAAFINSHFDVKPAYKNTLRSLLNASITGLDFAASPTTSAGVINRYVSDATHGKINQIVNAKTLDNSTKLILINALYFKANWRTQFTAKETRQQPFFLLNGDKKMVPLMRTTGMFRYRRSPEVNAEVLEMKYEDRTDMSMVIVLPFAKENFTAFEEKSAGLANVKPLLDVMRSQKVIVKIPRFRITQTLNLKKVLQRMGVKLAFDDQNANFCGISEEKKLAIHEIVQKVFIDVDEKGTEAAAVTAIRFGIKSAKAVHSPPHPIVFRADRPFLFFIRHIPSNSVIFSGRVVAP